MSDSSNSTLSRIGMTAARGLIGGVTGLLGRLGMSRTMYEGAYTNWYFAEEAKQKAFAGYQATEHDVFVATFSKSGTNWGMQIAQQIAYYGAAEFKHIHDLVAWPDLPFDHVVKLTDRMPREKSPTGLRIIKTHLSTGYLPYDPKAKYITILRDPKEVYVSGYYFIQGILGFLGKVAPDNWFEMEQQPGFLLDQWAIQASSLWAWRERPNVLILNFAEMKADLAGAVRQIAELMGVGLTAEQFSAVLARSEFQYMKQHEAKFAPFRPDFFPTKTPLPQMIRRGKTGESDELISLEQQKRIDDYCQTRLRELGSDLPYTDLFSLA